MEAEEADVDVEGDVVAAAQPGNAENTTSVVPDHYLDSSWRSENGFIPWTLDSTISEENRAVIEKMLLEEEYPSLIIVKVKASQLKSDHRKNYSSSHRS